MSTSAPLPEDGSAGAVRLHAELTRPRQCPPSAAKDVEAELTYAVAGGPRHVLYMYPPPAGTPRLSGSYQPQRLSIYDARPLAAELSLDVHGFSLHQQPT